MCDLIEILILQIRNMKLSSQSIELGCPEPDIRELRTLICFNSKNQNGMQTNPVFFNNGKGGGHVLDKNKNIAREKKKLIKLKFFVWANSRLEDLICMNRYWFNTNNGSRFSMVRVRMYPRLKIR